MSHLHPVMAQAIEPFAPKPMRRFFVKINGLEVRVLARSAMDAVSQVVSPYFEDGDVPKDGISIFVRPEP